MANTNNSDQAAPLMPQKRHSISAFFPCFNEQAAVEPLTRKTVAVLQTTDG